MKGFTKANNLNLIFFSIEYLRTKKDNGHIVDDTNLLTVQDSEKI